MSAKEWRAAQVEALRRRFGWAGPAVPPRPALILLSGLPGTGKSYLAQALANRYDVAVVRSDETRKALFPRPRYSSRESGTVYLICYAMIERLLADGYPVIFDATNLMRAGRRRARKLAERAGVPFLLLVTVSPSHVVEERLRRRSLGEAETFSSDADLAVHQKLAGTMDRVSEPAVVVDTSAGLQPAFDALDALLGTPPAARRAVQEGIA